MTPPILVRLRPRQERLAADALLASHADYPALRAVFPDPERRRRALRPFFTTTIRDAIPFGWVFAGVDSDRVLGVAVWLPPGAFPWSRWRKLRATPALIRVLGADPPAFRRFSRYGANTEREHPEGPLWYLQVLGIRPDAQRLGLGSRLMAPALRQADRDGVDCYLHSSDPANAAYYARFGFELVDDALPLVPDGPTHIAMRRRPRTGVR